MSTSLCLIACKHSIWCGCFFRYVNGNILSRFPFVLCRYRHQQPVCDVAHWNAFLPVRHRISRLLTESNEGCLFSVHFEGHICQDRIVLSHSASANALSQPVCITQVPHGLMVRSTRCHITDVRLPVRGRKTLRP